MSLTDNLRRFRLSLWLAFAAFVVCVVSFIFYAQARTSLREANARRYASLELVYELRQSSDDLTRMIRTYVATGDRRYRDFFEEISAIRDGLRPRPLEYGNVYWDLVLDERRPTPMGEPSGMIQRMSEAGFTSDELNQLSIAKDTSDRLIDIEHQAMALIEADDADSEDVIRQNREAAIQLVNNAAYHRIKADIMRPIAEVIRMVNSRTAQTVVSSEQTINVLLRVFIVSGLVLICMLWLIQYNLRLVLGGSVAQLSKAVISASGEMQNGQESGSKDRDSIMGKLVEGQQVNASTEGRWQESQRALSESEKRFRNMAEELQEGVCVVQDALIRFINPTFTEFMGQDADEFVERPFIGLVHPDDREALMERYRRRVSGEQVNPVNEFRVNTGSGGVLKVRARASNLDWAGRPAILYLLNPA